MAKAHPEMLVCAGTVLTVDQAKEAVDCGAQAVISPGTNPQVVEWCLKENVPVYPGVAPPTEVEAALALGLTTLKLFPRSGGGRGEHAQSPVRPLPPGEVHAHRGASPPPTWEST